MILSFKYKGQTELAKAFKGVEARFCLALFYFVGDGGRVEVRWGVAEQGWG